MIGSTLISREPSIRTLGRRSCRALGLGTLAVAVALVIGLPSAALADDLPFEPSLAATADSYTAGAHPNLTIHVSQPANHCTVQREGDECNFYPDNPELNEVVEYQDFKKLVLTMPEGLAADPNAVPDPKCTPTQPYPQHDPLQSGDSVTGWFCPPETQVGTVQVSTTNCFGTLAGELSISCGVNEDLEGNPFKFTGEVYMGVPEPGEQGRLIVLVGSTPPAFPFYAADEFRIDISLTVDSQGKITATADNLPDFKVIKYKFGENEIPYPNQPYDIEMTLFGDTGSDSGHPLLGNPTSCSAKELTGEAQGYAFNVEGLGGGEFVPGNGDGTTVPVSDNYPVVGCNSVPYAPNMSMTLDPPTPGSIPAITSTITQASGEQNSDSVQVNFPKGFKINTQTKADQCTDDQFNSGSCSDGSNIGTATAQSPLLPIDSAPISGPVYLGQTDLASGNIKLMTKLANDFLPDGITITGTSQINADGTLQANFNDVPDLPISNFTLALQGGDIGLVKNPKTCGPKTVDGTFTSHQGKQATSSPEVQIACDQAALQVDASTRRAKAHPTISLTASAASTQSLSFKLPAGLKVAHNLAQGKGYGALSFVTEDGTTETKLDLLGAGRKKASFSATKGGAQVTAVTVRHRHGNVITLSNLPANTLTATLDLTGAKNNFLTNPASCRSKPKKVKGKRQARGAPKDLNYSATVTNVEGQTMTPVLRSAMACGKRKGKKRR